MIVSEVPNWDADPVPCVVALRTNLTRSSSFRHTCHDTIDNYDRTYYNRFQARTDEVLRSFDGKNGVVFLPTVDNLCSEKSCTTMWTESSYTEMKVTYGAISEHKRISIWPTCSSLES